MLGNSFVKICLKKNPIDREKVIIPHIEARKTEFGKLCLVMGSLNHGPPDAHLHDELFDYVISFCNNPTNHDFQSFQALRVWSLKAKQSGAKVLLDEKSNKLQNLFDLINANWSNSLKGITELLTETLQNVLQMVNRPEVDQDLLENTLRCLSWKSKAKYPLLVVLLPRVGIIETLEKNADFGKGLSESLSTNYLAPAGANLYKVIVKCKDILPTWKKYIVPHLLNCLCYDKSTLVRTNAKNHWLKITQEYLPKEASNYLLDSISSTE